MTTVTLLVARTPLYAGMTGQDSSAPAWLFAFVDLAFLLLLGMTQLGGNAVAVDLGEIVVPRIRSSEAPQPVAHAGDAWQLRVHPRATETTLPFELVSADASSARFEADELRAHLRDLRARSAERPLLAPHAQSRSEDLLEAVAGIEDVWPGRRRVTVRRAGLRR